MNSRKLTTFPSLVLLTTVLLGACTTAATPAATEPPAVFSLQMENVETQVAPMSASLAVGLNTTYENAGSIEQQLVLGTLILEDSDLSVSKE